MIQESPPSPYTIRKENNLARGGKCSHVAFKENLFAWDVLEKLLKNGAFSGKKTTIWLLFRSVFSCMRAAASKVFVVCVL